jgi:hypothetical protein
MDDNGTKFVKSKADGGDTEQALALVALLALFGEATIIQINLSNRDKAAILNGFWPGAHEITLLTQFMLVQFSGDWSAYLYFANWTDTQSLERSAYLYFAKWADTQSLEQPDLMINIGDWLLLKSGTGILAATESGGSLCSSGDTVLGHSVCCWSSDMFHNGVGHKLNLCD